METSFEEKSMELQLITQDYVKVLIDIWKRTFDENGCMANFEKLLKHTKNLYKNFVNESIEKEEDLKEEIDKRINEAENLKLLLKVDIELNTQSTDKSLSEVQSELDVIVAQLRESLSLRQEQISQLLLEQEPIIHELGEPPRSLLTDPLATAEEIEQFRQHLQRLKEERVQRIHELSTLRREIKEYLQLLKLNVTTETEGRLLNYRKIILNEETFTGLRCMHKRYGEQVQKMRDEINDMRKNLEELWELLNTSVNTREMFREFREYTQTTCNLYKSELQRCLELKSKNLKHFVNQKREKIVEWWDKTHKSKLERSRFSHFNSNCYTDDLLMQHEKELENLKQYYESNKQIFELFADHKYFCERMSALEAKANDPGRLTNRGGQLLKEEKERKSIESKLSKIKSQITELVKQYEKREHMQFLVYGENILDVMTNDWEKDKENRRNARKQILTSPSESKPLGALRQSPLTTNHNLFKSENNLDMLLASGKTVARKLSLKRRSGPFESIRQSVSPVARSSMLPPEIIVTSSSPQLQSQIGS